MRCAIFLCLCVLIFVSLGEARSFNRDSMKNRFLSQFASRRFGFDKKTEVSEESTEEDDGKDDMIPTATLDVISHAIQCMLEEDMWENVAEDVWTSSDDTCAWTGYIDSEYFGCIHTIHSVNSYIKNPEKRKELDNAFRMFSEAIECSEMEDLGKALENSPEEFVHTASEIMGSHCVKRIEEMIAFFMEEENAKCLKPKEESGTEERELIKKLTDLLASDQSQKRAHKRSAEWDHEMNHAGFEAIVFAGYCVQYEDRSKLCSDTIHGVEVYVNAIKDGDQETIDSMERLFVIYNEVFKCGWFDKLRNGILESLTQCGTTEHDVISRVAVDINEMLNKHCERRMYKLANLHEDDNQESGQDNQKPGEKPGQKPEQGNQTKRKLLIQALSDLLKQK